MFGKFVLKSSLVVYCVPLLLRFDNTAESVTRNQIFLKSIGNAYSQAFISFFNKGIVEYCQYAMGYTYQLNCRYNMFESCLIYIG